MAGRIPQEFLDQLLSRVDLVAVISARLTLRRNGREFAACCPFHAEKTPSFTVSPRKQFYHCFGCGAHGSAIGFLMQYDGLDFLDALEELAQLTGLALPTIARDAQDSLPPLRDCLAQAEYFFRRQLREHPTRQRAIDYLQQRGLTGQIAKQFCIGYAPPLRDALSQSLLGIGMTSAQLIAAGLAARDQRDNLYDRFRDRIMFPIRDSRGRTIAFGGRALDKQVAAKYLNSPETPLFQKGAELYGLCAVRAQKPRPASLLVVEGYLDVVALAQHGLNSAVATLGTAISSTQVERLFRLADTVIFCFDGDRAGRAAGWRALETSLPFLHDGRQAQFLFLPDGEDPDSLVRREGAERFAQRIAQATPLDAYLFSELGSQVDLTTIAGRAKMATLAQPLIEKLPDGHFRDLLVARLQRDANLIHTRLHLPKLPPRLDRRTELVNTTLRKAIAFLLYYPELAQSTALDDALLRKSKQRGVQLLIELLDQFRDNPQLSTAALIERYRDTKTGAILEQLAQWTPEPELAEEAFDFAAEFADILDYLRQRDAPHRDC